MTKQANILFIASWYPSSVSPQAGNFIRNHAQALASANTISVIHAVSREQSNEFEITTEYVKGLFEVVVYYKKITSNHLLAKRKKYKKQLAAYRMAYAKVQEEKGSIDLVHLNVTFPAGLFALELKKKKGIPYLITEHWTAFLESDPIKLSGIQKQLIKKIGKHAEAICPVSDDLRKAMINFGLQNSYTVIPNVVDVDVFSYQPKKDNLFKTILHVSNLKDEHKNITGILRTMRKLMALRTDFRFVLVGNGDIAHFQKLSEQLEIPEERIDFHGPQPPDRIAAFMQESDCFILFSNYENLPCVISEALCTGTPVISTNVGGVSEMMNSSNGILIEAKNEQALFESLVTFLSNETQYNAQEIAQEAHVRYGAKHIAESYQQVYNSILS